MPRPGPGPGLVALTLANTLSQFFRIAMGLVAPELARDLDLAPAALGTLSAAWFLAFALAQPLVGMALDRLGPRRSVAGLFLLAGLGCVLLAGAESEGEAVLAQIAIGLGCAPVYMGTLVVVARFWPTERFAALSATLLAIAATGSILGATPLALLVEALGWRGSFLVFAALVTAGSAAVFLLVRDSPEGRPPPARSEGPLEVLRGMVEVVRLRPLRPLFPMLFATYAVVMAVRGLWAGPYLAEMQGLAPVPRGHALLVISLAMIGGLLGFAALERRLDRRKGPTLVATAVAMAGLLFLALRPGLATVPATLLLSAVVAGSVTYSLLMAQGRLFLPDRLVGRGLALLNMASFLGAALLQTLTGLVVAAAPAEPPGARWAWLFAFLALWLGLALLPYLRSVDPRAATSSR
ncbi:MAG: MFS transporter [Geminicoccaceae bacterium]|jgi:MFS family permease|nr:MAG: MFS transporter [Geminicoccaceae bacterium]